MMSYLIAHTIRFRSHISCFLRYSTVVGVIGHLSIFPTGNQASSHIGLVYIQGILHEVVPPSHAHPKNIS